MDNSAPGPTADRILQLLKTEGSASTGALARALGLTAEAARQQLQKLLAAGLVEGRGAATPAGVRPAGRPRLDWALTERGQARFPDRHALLSQQLIDAARGVFGEVGLDRLIEARQATMRQQYRQACDAPALGARLQQLAALRSQEGYMARLEMAGSGWLLIEDHCPICAAASLCQGFCRAELALFQELAGPGARVTREQHLLSGASRCAYRIEPVSPAAG